VETVAGFLGETVSTGLLPVGLTAHVRRSHHIKRCVKLSDCVVIMNAISYCKRESIAGVPNGVRWTYTRSRDSQAVSKFKLLYGAEKLHRFILAMTFSNLIPF